MKKKITILTLLVFFVVNINIRVSAKASPPPDVTSDGAILMDAQTGEILYNKNIDTQYPPASTTKIMTTLLTLENCKMDEMVTVGANPPRVIGISSSIGLREGEKLSVKDLLYGLLYLSGNDCAETLAEKIGGTSQNFVKMMNKRAKQLGCKNTNFVNPDGLYDDKHRTTPRDLALIMNELMKHKEFIDIAGGSDYTISPTNIHPKGIPLANEDKLVLKRSKFYYPNAEAGKTGYTVQSLHSYVASAKKGDQRLIVVLMHDQNKNTMYQHFILSKELFEWGFNNFELVKMYSKGQKVADYKNGKLDIPLIASKDYYYIREKGQNTVPVMKVKNISDLNKLSFKSGTHIADAKFSIDGTSKGTLELVSGINHNIQKNIASSKQNYNETTADYIIFSFFLIIFIFIFTSQVKRHNKKRQG